MTDQRIEEISTNQGLPVAPSMGPAIAESGAGHAAVSSRAVSVDWRVLWMCAICTAIGLVAGLAAQALVRLIWFFTNLSFFGRLSFHWAVARDNHLGVWVILVPIAGAFVIGLMLRYGSRGVGGHGIPEAMEQVLTNQSRIPVRLTFLKPLSAAISIGTGGPFGAEGPIIATGGAVGSLIGQLLPTTASERKTLLAAGAAAGLAAAFGAPIGAVLLAIELLLFEFRARSIIPVAFASAAAAGLHVAFEGFDPMIHFAGLPLQPTRELGLAAYTLLGAIVGVGAVVMTQSVYAFEHAFEHLPHRFHWMWHPMLGALAVGIIGYVSPATLGPGYFNLNYLLSGQATVTAAATLGVLKLASWSIALGSGTAGGTLAPVFTIGGCLAAVVGAGMVHLVPAAGCDVRIAALVGMAAIFAGASRALLTSVVLAFELTLAPEAIMPVLCGCCAAYLVSSMLMQQSIMTGKMARSGVHVPADYAADPLEQMSVAQAATLPAVTLPDGASVGWARQQLQETAANHRVFPLVDEAGDVAGMVRRRELLDPAMPADRLLSQLSARSAVAINADASLRQAVDMMAEQDVGRLVVVGGDSGRRVVGLLSRSDVLAAYGQRQRLERQPEVTVRLLRRQPRS